MVSDNTVVPWRHLTTLTKGLSVPVSSSDTEPHGGKDVGSTIYWFF